MKVKWNKDLSFRKLKVRVSRKTNPSLRETIMLCSESAPWKPIAKTLSNSTRKYLSVNLDEIDSDTKAGDIVVVLGKVLGTGDLTKKVRICALGISASALQKLKKTKSEFASIADEVKINKKAEGIKLIG